MVAVGGVELQTRRTSDGRLIQRPISLRDMLFGAPCAHEAEGAIYDADSALRKKRFRTVAPT